MQIVRNSRSLFALAGLLVASVGPSAGLAQDEGGDQLYNPDRCNSDSLFTSEQESFRGTGERALRTSFGDKGLSRSTKANLDAAAEYFVFAITSDEFRNDALGRAQKITRQYLLRSEQAPREYLIQQMVEKLRVVLRQCDVGERMNALIFLSELDIEKASLRDKTPAVPYWGTGDVYLDVIENPAEQMMVKVRAAQELPRLFRDAKAPQEDYNDYLIRTSAALSKLLEGDLPIKNGEDYEWWLAYYLTVALGDVDQPTNLLLEPVGVQALVDIVTDNSQNDILRAKAFRALSKVPFADGNQFDIAPIITAQMQFMQDWLGRYNQSPTYWENRHVAVDLYLSFKPETPQQAEQGEGWLAQIQQSSNRGASGPVESAFQVVKPIFKSIVRNRPGQQEPVGRELVAGLTKWLESAPPTGEVHPRIGAITITPKPKPAAAEATEADPAA